MFNLPLDATAAGNVAHYRVTQAGRFRRARPVVIAVRFARYNAANHSVALTLGRFVPARPLTLTITGLASPGGSASPIVTRL
jgi:hypothetical protein